MRKLNHALLAGALALACASCTAEKEANYQVIPLPQEVSLTQENPFKLNENVLIAYPENNALLQRNAEFLSEYIQQATNYAPKTKAIAAGEQVKNAIVLGLDPSIANKEGYVLTTTPEGINLNGQTENGVFYGIQTLRKSIPAEAKEATILIPAGEIKDEPRFSYRGMHLDVGRHFFPKEFMKKYIDLLALHNMNTFHWHLTDDQGWRIEIKKYPKLTEIGSQRSRTVIGRNTQEYDNTPYGGFFTQEEAKEIVKYAQERYITVIPEVDLPGHMLAALAAYPEMGCTGGPYEVCPRWGIFEDVLCIGNDQTMQFLEDVMSEIIEIFPSKYVHIGGDEAPRTRWEKCPKCQARIKTEGLKADKNHTAEDRLQSYCMTRIEEFLNSKGRQIIGWDEILEGDVAPNATVMSWRGMEGGIKAAQLGHDVIMTPTSFCYFDYYQTADTKDEPLGIGGYVPIEKVYSLEPVPAVLTEEQSKHILGAQANLWTEYIHSSEHVEYMVLPRMAALAEVQWTQPEKKDFKDFTKRLARLMKFYQRDGFNYAKHVFDLKVDFTPDVTKKAVVVTLSTIDDAPIYYTLDGTEPTTASLKYTEPVSITETADFQAVVIRPEGKSKVVNKKISFNKATYCPIELTFQPSEKYKFGGAITLVDGMKGNDSYATGAWLGFVGGDVEAIIDLGQETEIKQVATNAIVDMSAWIMGSTGLVVSISDDNKEFREVAAKDIPAETNIDKKGVENYEITFDPVKARYVKVVIKRSPALPKGHAGEGKAAYMFIDEIEVD
ncbi:glycoside hydrolase family 20 protein [Bacteroides intestinalis]|jgi:hexosaminidase|uniref:beta-N-acetylhexosaminidase n=2 Tax=Bacteroides intestinalis TaxID=329854 RepID=A0A4Q5HJ41_9BACE|nr:glycoside hydrolase family 20 protein [Bacteroides intestinalis]KAA4695819.1 family 20 glycosylhydrolase [Bacteroides intestinalis]KAA4722094.1 family 20 glycosylhydrolase [Bacteroides intestinalis]RGX83742.1 beta-N-acetylhexosaminidase [Bacteroides intestinalis]RYT83061.1 beta-N-acetylhexosaminidase [Bacteroides intestinalis]